MGAHSQEQAALLTDYNPASAYSQAYYTIYTNIRLNWRVDPVSSRTILFTTPAMYKNYSAAAANIAIVAAQSGTPTILIDADLYAPTLQQRFALGEQEGLTDLLSAEHITTEAFSSYLSKTFLPDLYVLSTGTRKVSPIEARQRLSAHITEIVLKLSLFLNNTQKQTGLIILHSPPLKESPDALFFSTLVDQTFLLLVAGQTTRTQARQAQEQFELAHAKLTGAILLDV